MNIHKNARLTPLGRERLVKMMLSGQTPESAARLAGVCPRTARKWQARYKTEGAAGLRDRTSRPKKLRNPTSAQTVKRIIALRRQRWTGKHIACETGVSSATVSRVLKRAGLSRMKDGKKWGSGWEYVHVAIDDHSRLSFSQIHPNEKAVSAIAHLKAAVAWYKKLGVRVERVMTDNGPCYKSKAFAKACRDLKIKHIRTKPYTPKTNGKAERFIQTALREWAYARAYETSDHRTDDLPLWTHLYNWHRPHGGIKDQTPISRLGLNRDNLLRLHI